MTDYLCAVGWNAEMARSVSAFLASNESATVLVAVHVALECTCISLAILLCWERVAQDLF